MIKFIKTDQNRSEQADQNKQIKAEHSRSQQIKADKIK